MAKLPLPELHPDAAALTAFRGLPNGVGRQYTVSEAPSREKAIKYSLRVAWFLGFVKATTHREQADEPCGCYAVLDVLDGDDEIVQDFCIPTSRASRWWYQHLGLRVVDVEAEVASYYGREG